MNLSSGVPLLESFGSLHRVLEVQDVFPRRSCAITRGDPRCAHRQPRSFYTG
jgi:hypothetical protein